MSQLCDWVMVLCRMWRTRKKAGKPITLLSLPEAGQLVFLVDRSTTRASEVQVNLADHLSCMHPLDEQYHHKLRLITESRRPAGCGTGPAAKDAHRQPVQCEWHGEVECAATPDCRLRGE